MVGGFRRAAVAVARRIARHSVALRRSRASAAVITNANAGLRWLGARQPDLDEVRQTLARIVRDGTRAGEVTSRIRGLGWQPKKSIREAVELTVDWLATNRWVFAKRRR